MTLVCYGSPGTSEWYRIDPEDPNAFFLEGFIAMQYDFPLTRPNKYGNWIAQTDGTWLWVQLPAPVKVLNGVLLSDEDNSAITIGMLPGSVASRLSTLEPMEMAGVAVEAGSMACPESGRDMIACLEPAAALAVYSFALPDDADSRNGQQVKVYTTQEIGMLTITSAGAVVRGGVVYMAPNDCICYAKIKPGLWARVQP